jgi:hypothetical protein
VPDGRPFGSHPVLRHASAVVAASQRDASLLRMELGPTASSTSVEVVAPAVHPMPPSTAMASIIIIGRVDAWQWTVQHLRTEVGQPVEVLDVDHDPSGDVDRQWQQLLREASCVLVLDHDAQQEHLHWGLEALSAGVPVVTTGSWAASLPPGVVRRLDGDISNVTMYAHVAALAQPSPLRREQLRLASAYVSARSVQQRGVDLAAVLDGRSVSPPDQPARRAFAPLGATSALCRMTDFESPVFTQWCTDLAESIGPRRKLWEYVAIAAALEQRGCLTGASHGLGFGVGTEPLTAAFAARGCRVTATDLDADRPEASDWAPSGQLAARAADLNLRGLCEPSAFAERVEFRPVDMTAIPSSFDGQFDFCWSSCAFEHLGSIEAGLQFVVDSVRTLRPGGVAVHTTELVLSSDTRTLQSGSTVLFRESDLRELVDRLERDGHRVAPLDTELGDELLDRHVDAPPFSSEPHLKLELGGHITTSVSIIIQRA